MNLEEYFQNYDERLLAKKIVDAAKGAVKSFCCSSTNFLDPAEQDVAQVVLKELTDVSYRWFDGLPDAERRGLVFAPEEWLLDEWDETALLRLQWNQKYSRPITHRDVLGSLMSMGIEREIIGDIKVSDGAAYVVVMKPMVDFLMLNMERIGGATIKAERCETMDEVEDRFKEIHGTVPSCRLDAVVAEAFSISRSQAQELVRGGKVRVNHRPVENVSFELKEKDLISMKGYGRARLWELNGKTRKDRQSLLIRKYI